MMNFQKFAEKMRTLTAEKFGDNYHIELQEILKENGKQTGLAIIEKGNEQLQPIYYLEESYRKYCTDNQNLDTIANEIHMHYQHELNTMKQLEKTSSSLSSFESIRSKIFFHIVNSKDHPEFFSEVPWVPFLDMAVVFRILIKRSPDGTMSSLVRKQNLEAWGITPEELYKAASENTPCLFPVWFKPLDPYLKELVPDFQEEEHSALYILSNKDKWLGASSILYPEVLRQCAEQLHCDFYILPSSLHEVLLLPKKDEISVEELRMMVQSVNQMCVAPEDQLSDSVYLYCKENNRLELA